MATNFPTSLDNLSNPAGSDPVNNPSHAVQHANVNDAIEALETKVGVNNSAVTTSLDYRVKQLETNPTYTNEMAQDAVAAALAAGTHTNITINYNDTGNSISISAAAGYTNEEAVDAVAAALTAGSGISISYNDPANTITISVDSTIATKTYVDTAITSLGNTAATTYVPQSDVGNIDGVASLDGTGKVPDSQIPAGIARDSEVTSAISTEVTNRNSAISTAINNLINSAPGTLDTLGEIATQLAADESAVGALTTVVNGKVSKAGGDVITSSLPSVVGLAFKATSSQTANLQEWQNSSATILSGVNAAGQHYVGSGTLTGGSTYAITSATASSTTVATFTHAQTVQPFVVGQQVVVTSVTPTYFNGTWTVTSTGGTSGSYSFTVLGSGFTASGTATAFGTFRPSAQLSITSPNALTMPLVIQASSGQSANLIDFVGSTGGRVASIQAGGAAYFGGTVFSNSYYVGTGLWDLNSTGTTITTNSNTANTLGAGFVRIKTRAAGQLGLAIAGTTTTGTITAATTSGTTITYTCNASGYLVAGQTITITGVLSAGNPGGTAGSGFNLTNATIATASATQFTITNSLSDTYTSGGTISVPQTGDLTQWQDSTGAIKAYINNAGAFVSNQLIGTAGYMYSVSPAAFGTSGLTNSYQVQVVNGATTRVGLMIKAIASQTANLTEWQNSSGSVVASIDASGNVVTSGINAAGNVTALYAVGIGNIAPYTNSSMLAVSTNNGTTSSIGILVRGKSGQTGDLQQWQDSSGSAVASISSTGVIKSGNIVSTNTTGSLRYYWGDVNTGNQSLSYITGSTNAGLVIETINIGSVNTTFDSCIPLSVKGLPNQTGDLQRWTNSSNTVLSKVDSTGAMFTITPADSTNSTQVATTAYVKSNINNLINSAPGALDTLNELAAALGNDANFSTTITNSLALKAPLASPTFTGTPLAPTATSGTNTTQIATTAFVKTAIDSSVQPGALYQTSAPTSPAVGQIWIDSDDDVTVFDSNIIRRKSFTATAGQTVFVTDIPFIDGFEQVFMNGLLLVKTTDYTVSGGNTVTLASGAAVSDIIEVVSVTGANSVNTYTQAEVDTLIANNKAVSPQAISANTTLVKKKRYYVTSASALTLTLPASPTLDDEIQIVDASGNASTYNITVARNGSLINGGTGNLIIDTNGGWYTLIYTGSTYGWKVG